MLVVLLGIQVKGNSSILLSFAFLVRFVKLHFACNMGRDLDAWSSFSGTSTSMRSLFQIGALVSSVTWNTPVLF